MLRSLYRLFDLHRKIGELQLELLFLTGKVTRLIGLMEEADRKRFPLAAVTVKVDRENKDVQAAPFNDLQKLKSVLGVPGTHDLWWEHPETEAGVNSSKIDEGYIPWSCSTGDCYFTSKKPIKKS